MANIGQIIDDKYEILTLIGQGGMSKVYLARDRRLNKQWAVKEIQKKARDKNNEIVVQSAIAEANLIKQLDHPSIVRIVDIIDNPDVIYIVEDYIEGETLNTILNENGAQPQELVIEWAMQICEALEYLHTRKQPIIYRDMKPSNVMLKPDGNIKIIDFGIAREYKEQSLADTVSLGTKGYAAPEQFGGKGQTDARTDVYCLGVTLYHLVTGHSPCDPPYEIYPIRHWNPQLDPGLEAIIEKCTQLNPDDRYQSCAELLYALQHYQENGAVYRAKQKKKLVSFIVTAVLCVVFAITGVLGLFMKNSTDEQKYYEYISLAEKSSDFNTKMNNYELAFELKPEVIDPYFDIIEYYKEDANFSEEEEDKFHDLVTKNLGYVKNDSRYGELNFEIGKLYWYYYFESDVGRIKFSQKWFVDAVNNSNGSEDYYTMAKIYTELGYFHSNVSKASKEGEDNGLYVKYWKTLTQLNDILLSDENAGDIVKLNMYQRTLNDIEQYSYKFKKDGVKKSEMESLFNNIRRDLNKIHPSSDVTIKLKDDVSDRLVDVQETIDTTY